jgi:DNA-binding transcriptional ArsR family regulator
LDLAVLAVSVIENPAAAESSLDPVRSRLLAELGLPASATTLAGRLGLSRQKVNYHLRTLERHGLIELVEERRKGNTTERIMRATAASYVISPVELAAFDPDPDRAPDQLSALWLLALAARMVKEVGSLIGLARVAGRPLATFAIDAEVRFASARERAEFAAELGATIERLVTKYHTESARSGRTHRLLVALHPSITRDPPDDLHPDNQRTTTKEH